MGDFNASDCSWKKMFNEVIAKANNKIWISTIKTEPNDDNGAVSSSNFSLEDESIYDNGGKNDCSDVTASAIASSLVEQHLEIIDETLDTDPHCLDSPGKRKRKGSGPKNESPKERSVRLARMSAYAAQRLANESPEQRAFRLKRMSEYAARRLAQESSEQRAKRLARMSAYAAKRLAAETPEQRSLRLARMSAYAAKRHAMKKLSGHTVGVLANESEGESILPDQS